MIRKILKKKFFSNNLKRFFFKNFQYLSSSYDEHFEINGTILNLLEEIGKKIVDEMAKFIDVERADPIEGSQYYTEGYNLFNEIMSKSRENPTYVQDDIDESSKEDIIKCIELFTKAINSFPFEAYYYYLRANAFFWLKENECAMKDFEVSTKIMEHYEKEIGEIYDRPLYARCAFNYATEYQRYIQKNSINLSNIEYSELNNYFKKCVDADPNFYLPYFNLALDCIPENHQKGLDYLEKVIEINKDYDNNDYIEGTYVKYVVLAKVEALRAMFYYKMKKQDELKKSLDLGMQLCGDTIIAILNNFVVNSIDESTVKDALELIGMITEKKKSFKN